MTAGRSAHPMRPVLAALLTTVALAHPVAAQEAPETLFAMLGRIILGSGTAKVAIDTPQAVTVLEQSDLDREQATTIGEIFASVPGVQAVGASARSLGQAFNIRGIGATEQSSAEARIIVTVDGAPKFFEQYRLGSFFGDLELFKRVEVLRGPASSTLYGSGAIGGVINFTTKDASDFLSDGKTSALRFKTSYASNGQGKTASVIFANRPTENAEFLGSLNFGTSDDLQNGNGIDLAGTASDRWSGLLKGKFTFGADADQTVSLSFARTDSDLKDTVVAQTGGAAIGSFGNADLHTVDDTVVLSYGHAASANPWVDLKVTLSWTGTSVDKSNFSFGAMCAPGQTQVLCDSTFGYRTATLKVENTAEFSAGNWENFVTAGIQMSRQNRNADSSRGAFLFHPEGEDTKLGAYAQGEFTLNERLTLIPGLRVDFGDISPSDAVIAAGGSAQSDSAKSAKLAAMFKINDNWGVFGSIASTERMPTLDELYSSEGAAGRGPGMIALPRTASLNLEKERARTIELGLTYQRSGLFSDSDSLQLKATAFHNDVTNMIATTARPIVPVGTPGSVPYFSNINQAELWGVELEAGYDAERWFSQLAYSNVKTQDSNTGLTLADTPAENLALTLGAKLPAQDLVIGWRMQAFADIKTASATTTGPGYATHDLFVTWSPDEGALQGIDVNFGIENLFDASYKNNLSSEQSPGRSFKISLAKTLDW